MNPHAQSSKPWFKEPWPWLLAIMPITAVIAGSFTLWFAITSDDGLVVDDYYKQGKAINLMLERDREAHALGIQAQLAARGSSLRLKLAGRFPPPGVLTLKIIHPTRGGDDHEVRLSWDGADYSGHLPHLAGSHYNLQLTPEHGDWRLTGTWPTGSTVTLTPQL